MVRIYIKDTANPVAVQDEDFASDHAGVSWKTETMRFWVPFWRIVKVEWEEV